MRLNGNGIKTKDLITFRHRFFISLLVYGVCTTESVGIMNLCIQLSPPLNCLLKSLKSKQHTAILILFQYFYSITLDLEI